MRFFRILFSVLFVLVAAFSIYVRVSETKDYTPPKLTCDTDTMTLSVEDDESKLLEHVTASDEKDGDLTKSVIVESISSFLDGNKATVTFAVCDSDNNVAKLTANVVYSDYTPPVFSFSQQQVYYVGATRADLLAGVSATDKLDGDISSRVTVAESTLDLSKSGVYPITYRVTTAKGVSSEVTVNAYVYDSRLQSTITLKQYLVYTDVNKKINPKAYLGAYEEKYLAEGYFNDYTCTLEIIDEVDYKKPGVYYVTYRLVKKSDKMIDGMNAEQEILAEAYLAVVVKG